MYVNVICVVAYPISETILKFLSQSMKLIPVNLLASIIDRKVTFDVMV